jgi:antitoxin VapB
VALEERLERVRHHKNRAGLAERLLAIGRETAAHSTAAERAVDHGELLYDEHGLPRDC